MAHASACYLTAPKNKTVTLGAFGGHGAQGIAPLLARLLVWLQPVKENLIGVSNEVFEH